MNNAAGYVLTGIAVSGGYDPELVNLQYEASLAAKVGADKPSEEAASVQTTRTQDERSDAAEPEAKRMKSDDK